MKIIFAVFCLLVSINANAFFWSTDQTLSEKTIDFWQPEIDETFQIPERPYDIYNYERQLKKYNLNHFKRNFQSYNQKGKLFSSWNPSKKQGKVPTIIIMHGGHGINPIEFQSAEWFKNNVNANVLILDSFWSRGKFENHATTTRFGVNTMVLDIIAVQRWLELQPEVDPRYIYVYGGSIGGWLALRIMTDDPFITKEVKGKIRSAFSVYPACREAPQYGGKYSINRYGNYVAHLDREPWLAPNLGPYHSPVYVFTAGKDSATNIEHCAPSVFTDAKEWKHFEDATHAWDLPVADGVCSNAKNPQNKFLQCRSDLVTNTVLEKIKSVILTDLNN